MDGQRPLAQPANRRYEVRLEVFSGPLDLLLHLIQRRELDITVVSLAAVTGQYLSYLQSLSEPDPDHLADFLVVAARLLAIKAMALVARPAEAATPAEDEGTELVRALVEYQLFQRAAAQLRTWEGQPRRSYPRVVPVAPIRIPAPDGLHLDDLVAALRARLAATAIAPAPGAPAVAPPDYTVGSKIAHIVAALACRAEVSFADLVHPLSPPLEVIVTFLALLELLKQRRVGVAQDAIFGQILITLPAMAPPDAQMNGDG